MNVTLALEAVGVCAEGMPDWPAARAVLRKETPFDLSIAAQLGASELPATERRRANTMSRWALQVAADATRDLDRASRASLPTVFASADGDGTVLAQMLHDLSAQKVALSPTTFHNSVFNAPAGYWSIAAHAPAASTTICAAEGSFGAGLLEAAAQASASDGTVLLVACDLAFPADSPITTPASHGFACALRLTATACAGALGSITDIRVANGAASPLRDDLCAAYQGNASAAALALLQAIARVQPGPVRLPYTGDDVVELAWQPNA